MVLLHTAMQLPGAGRRGDAPDRGRGDQRSRRSLHLHQRAPRGRRRRARGDHAGSPVRAIRGVGRRPRSSPSTRRPRGRRPEDARSRRRRRSHDQRSRSARGAKGRAGDLAFHPRPAHLGAHHHRPRSTRSRPSTTRSGSGQWRCDRERSTAFPTPPASAGRRLTLVGLLVWMLVMGPDLFSPGSLNSQAKAQTLGGVTSHAQLARDCGACHAAPWSSQTMDDKCLACHTDVRTQVKGHSGIHGGMLGATSSSCKACHSEHLGPNGALTANFNHDSFPFKLTGKHASVPCQQCHANATSLQDLRNTPQDCYSCHAKDDKHGGSFGRLCGQCHKTTDWGDAVRPQELPSVPATPRTTSTGVIRGSTTRSSRSTTAPTSKPPRARRAIRRTSIPTPATDATSTRRPTSCPSTRARASPHWPTAFTATPGGRAEATRSASGSQSTSRRAVSMIPAIASAAVQATRTAAPAAGDKSCGPPRPLSASPA